MLTLLRHPDVLERLRREPELVIRMVEELLRYEPPVHFVPWRAALDDIDDRRHHHPGGLAGHPGARRRQPRPEHVRDPDRFDPDRFDPDRFGLPATTTSTSASAAASTTASARPLARLETQIALTELARRLENPRLVADPPPYRPNPVLRGPLHLPVRFDGMVPAQPTATTGRHEPEEQPVVQGSLTYRGRQDRGQRPG